MELPKSYSTLNQWIPVIPDSGRKKKTSNLHEIMKRNAEICNNHAQMGVLGFSGVELGQVPFGQILEAVDPAGGTLGSSVSPYWAGTGGCAGSGQTNRVDSVISTQSTLEPALECNSHMSFLPNLNSLPKNIIPGSSAGNSHMSFLLNLNSLPENIIPGTSAGNIMTIPSIPLNIDKFQRNIDQNYRPIEIIDLESETASNQICQQFLNQGGSSFITSQQRDIDRTAVVDESEGDGENNGTDLNSTPPPKTKRKKHRPKVIRECKLVRPLKAATPNPKDGNEPSARRKKYTRKKGIDAQDASATSVVENVDNSPQTNNKHVTRSLKFDDPRSQEAIGNNVAGPEIREAEKSVYGFDLNVSLNQFGFQNVTFPQYPHQSQTLQHEAFGGKKKDFAGIMNGTTSSIDNGKDINGLAWTINDQDEKRDSYHVSSSLNESCNGLHKRRRTDDTLNAYCSMTSIQNGSNIESTFADIQGIMAFQNMQSSMNMMAHQMASGVSPITVRCLNVSDNGTHVQSSDLINGHNFSSSNTINNHVRGSNTMNFNNPNAVNCHNVSSTSTINNEVPCLQRTSTSEKATQIHINSGTNHEACRPKAHVEAVTDDQVKLKTRTPRKKETPRITSKPTNGKQMENIVPNIRSGLAKIPNNSYKPSGVLITYKDPMDALARKLEQLSIDDAIDSVMPNLENALVPYANGARAMVAFENPLEFFKKKKPRPKVDLDPESNRVWELLMGLEDDEEKDVNKEKWWEEERRLFLGRAESFISRMKLIQGDRRFSPWKGSVVDSVIGVFLTQNVSDHLSSSAFMCLAARFPLQAKVDDRTKGLETASSPIIISNEDNSSNELKKIGPDELNNKKSEEIISNFNKTELGLGRKSPDRGLATSIISESSKTCSNCPDQAFNTNSLNPLSNFEAAELLGNGYTSFTELLQMANDGVLSSNPQAPFNNNQVDWSSFQDSFMDSGFGGNLYTKQVNSSRVNESTMHNDQLKRTSMIKSEVQEEISNKSTVKISSKGNKAPKVQVKKRKSSDPFDWDSLRRNIRKNRDKKTRRSDAIDSLDYEALRLADVKDISYAIRERGMNDILAERMKAFLNRLVEDHGSIDLEWLRDVPPEKAKDYLLSIRGLGLKSVECVRLLTLHHLAFPVDTNVGRIAVRLGWVPLQPLPESLQLHLLEMYPMLETIQKYLWPRLCKLDQGTLYELHYHLITFGKVFCTKSKPNCNSCPMKGECKHFASAFASARLALPGTEEKRILTSSTDLSSEKMPTPFPLPQFESSMVPQMLGSQIQNICRNSKPIIEEPASPEPKSLDSLENDIEDAFLYDDLDEIPTIRLNIEEFTENLQEYMKDNNMAIEHGDLSKALVTIDSEAASIPMPKLKNVSRLRTEHLVYELPDSHPLLEGFDRRVPDDPTKYLLAIWTPGETAQSIEAPKACSNSRESGNMCDMSTCFSCNSIREAQTRTVRGTILIPCRTANGGSFPLNGTYFQINEVFADHASSCNPIDVPRDWIWKLERRTVYFGTSVTSIFRGLTTEAIQLCFRRGFVCVRGYDRKTRSPKPLSARLHFTASKAAKKKKQDNGRSK